MPARLDQVISQYQIYLFQKSILSMRHKKETKQEELYQNIEAALTELNACEYANAKAKLEGVISNLEETAELDPLIVILKLAYSDCAFALGNIEDAVLSLKSAQSSAQKLENPELESQALIKLAVLSGDRGNYQDAHEKLILALKLAQQIRDEMLIEACYGNLGINFILSNQFEEAKASLEQAIEYSQDDEYTLAWHIALCKTLVELGLYGQSIERIDRLFAQHLESDFQPDQNKKVLLLCVKGEAQYRLNDYKSAAKTFEQSLKLEREASVDGDLLEGILLGNLASCHLKTNKKDQALQSAKQALGIAERKNDLQSQASHMDTLAEIYYELNQNTEAISLLSKAIDIASKLHDRIGERIYLTNLAKAFIKEGKHSEALEKLEAASKIFELQRTQIRSDYLKTSFASLGQDLYELLVTTCLHLGLRVKALEYISKSKSRAIIDMMANSPIALDQELIEKDPELETLICREKELTKKIKELERRYWQYSDTTDHTRASVNEFSPQQDLENDLPALYGRWQETAAQIRQFAPNYSDIISVAPISIDSIQSLWSQDKLPLSKHTAIIEIYVCNEMISIFALTLDENKDSPLNIIEHSIHGDDTTQINQEIANLTEMLLLPNFAPPLKSAQRIYEKLLKPVLNLLPSSINHLLLIPHGNLYHLPFSALYDGKQFLIEKYSISNLHQLSLLPILASSQRSTDSKNSFLLAGIENYGAQKKNSDSAISPGELRGQQGKLSNLSFAIQEIESIAKFLNDKNIQSTVLKNESVSEKLATDFRNYSIIHYAGHAAFNARQPLASGLVLGRGEILSAQELLSSSKYYTEKTKLMVLSACETGINEITSGGEIIGLTRALLYCGIPNLLMSLWSVSDQCTAKIMKTFYGSLLTDEFNIGKALQNTQKWAIKERLHPYYWAPFIHFGLE